MSLMLLKKISLLFLLIAAAFLSTSFAGRRTKFVSKLAVDEVEAAIDEEMSGELSSTDDHETVIHERLLRANAKDYGKYDPAPALVRPPFKLIPN